MAPIHLDEIIKHNSHLLPSQPDIAFYKAHGWYITPEIIDPNIIDNAKAGALEFYEGKVDNTLLNDDKIANANYNEKASIHNNEFVTLQKNSLAELGFHPLILATAAILSNSNEVRLFADSLITKKPTLPNAKTNTVGWHTDKAYWPTCSSNELLTAWIPLQDCSIDMGPLFHIDKSHSWKDNVDLKRFYSFNKQELGDLESYLKEEIPNHKEIPMLLKKGQVSFHNCNTIHASRPNISSVDRMALAVHFQDQTNEYKKVFDTDGNLISIGYDQLCRKDKDGNPDYRDPNIFPVLLSQ
ncbi:MAG: ectoine hydroxylase-related dioxygenase (phytanoyl-CoA dioxygenase family) [Roseivirga sp.]|jgi:ectoine hydroxylase-related dioxygenase (phytanoyl-CoA dioxygenase family)